MKLRNLFLVISILSIQAVTAQTKPVLKARENFANGKYPEARKYCISGLEDDKSTTELWYIKAISEFEMYQLEKYRKEETDYFKESMKSAVKAIGYDDDLILYKVYGERFKPLVAANNKEAISNYGQGRYPRALQTYKTSYELTGDTIALGMAGHCYFLMKQNLDAVKTLRKVATMNYGANAENKHKKTYVREAFEDLTDYYLNEAKMKDSAMYYCEMGLSVFPLNVKLLSWERQMLNIELASTRTNTGYSAMYNQWLQKALIYFPSDTFYLHEQNNFYLNRIGYLTQENDWAEAELTYQDFFQRKADLLGRKSKNATDPFSLNDTSKFITQSLEYYLSNNAPGGTVFFFYKWYPTQFKTGAIDEKRMEALLNNPPKTISHRLIGMLMDHAGNKYPKNATLKKHRMAIYSQWIKQPIAYYDWQRIITLSDSVVKDFPKNTTLKPQQQQLLARGIDSLTKHGQMDLAWGLYYRLQKENPKFATLNKLQISLAKADFEKRFKGSKIAYSKIKGKQVSNTGWSGVVKTCTPGTLPDSTNQKITNRINYFRQNAGIPSAVRLDEDKQIACLAAATMYAPIGVFSREPKPETHKCFSQPAADAAAYGQAILESNPAQSVTVLMSDNKSDEMYNRRLITHPGLTNYGYGCADNNSVFWMADKSLLKIDSSYYKDHFVTWPAAGAAPTMLAFDKWSFSILQPLAEATVSITSIKHGKVECDVREEAGNGLGLPTLVIVPLGMPKWETGDVVKTTVTLKNKKVFTYSTELF